MSIRFSFPCILADKRRKMKSDAKEPPLWQAFVTKEDLMETERQISQIQKELEKFLAKWEPKQIVGKTQEELEGIFAKWRSEQVAEIRSKVFRYNQVAVLIKILFVNREFLTGIIDHYDSGEPVILATLARCTFELFLATRDAFSSPEKFREFVGRSEASVIRFNEKVLDEVTIQGNSNLVKFMQSELVRLEHRKTIWATMFGPTPTITRPDLNFRDLATQFGMGEYYDFDYGILSLFVHPSLFYVAVAPRMSSLLSGEERPSTFQRDAVKAWSLSIALDFSRKLLKFTESIRSTFESL
ncbi:MAG: DUF5677 domain-containing protein [Candidatus Bathyarchaeia archaeon]